jgi:hypothetical protein
MSMTMPMTTASNSSLSIYSSIHLSTDLWYDVMMHATQVPRPVRASIQRLPDLHGPLLGDGVHAGGCVVVVWMDGWIDGWVDEWTDGWMDG